jgi:hypothetical protein
MITKIAKMIDQVGHGEEREQLRQQKDGCQGIPAKFGLEIVGQKFVFATLETSPFFMTGEGGGIKLQIHQTS